MSHATDAAPSSATVAAEVRGLLAKRRMSQTELASKLGWSYVMVNRRLAGQVDITVEDLGAFAAALEVSPARLLDAA